MITEKLHPTQQNQTFTNKPEKILQHEIKHFKELRPSLVGLYDVRPGSASRQPILKLVTH